MEYSTSRLGWTRAQTDALGVEWPLRKGWHNEVIGKTISSENLELFKARIPAADYKKR